MPDYESETHWLVELAEAAGLGRLELPLDAPLSAIRATWAEVARASNVDDRELARRIANHFRLPLADLSTAEPQAAKLLPERTARAKGVLPLRATDRTITVATADPLNYEAEQAIRFLSGRQPSFEVCAPGPLLDAIERSYSRGRVVEFVLQNLAADAEAAREDGAPPMLDLHVDVDAMDDPGPAAPTRSPVSTPPAAAPATDAASLGPVANLTNRLIRQAVEVGAAELIIEPERSSGRVFLRVDGVIEHYMHLPVPALVRVVSRFKDLSRMDVTNRVRPQIGQMEMVFDRRRHVLRVRTEPTGGVERVTVSIRDTTYQPTLEALSLPDHELRELGKLLRESSGLVAISGPSGSGRSTLLQALARRLAAAGRSVTAVALTAERTAPGTHLILADPDRGTSLAGALQSAAAAGSDAIALSEPPDANALMAAVALARRTLVMFVTNAQDALGTLPLLSELGLDRASMTESMRAVIATRLVRRFCEPCSRPARSEDLPAAEAALARAYGLRPARFATGCRECRGTGYRGRVPILEVVRFPLETRPMLSSWSMLPALKQELERRGARWIRDCGLHRVRAGETSLSDIERVLGASDETQAPRPRPIVLVVDDAPEDRLLMRSVLEPRGFDIVEAHDGLEALEHLERHRDVSLVILDLVMPGAQGSEILERMRAAQHTSQLPVMILTALNDDGLEVDLLAAGADDFLRKPIDPERLSVRVGAVLRRAEGSPRGSSRSDLEAAPV